MLIIVSGERENIVATSDFTTEAFQSQVHSEYYFRLSIGNLLSDALRRRRGKGRLLTVNLGRASVGEWNLIVGLTDSPTTNKSTQQARYDKSNVARTMGKNMFSRKIFMSRTEKWKRFPDNTMLNSFLGSLYSFYTIEQNSAEVSGSVQSQSYTAIPQVNNKLEFVYEMNTGQLRLRTAICIINNSDSRTQIISS